MNVQRPNYLPQYPSEPAVGDEGSLLIDELPVYGPDGTKAFTLSNLNLNVDCKWDGCAWIAEHVAFERDGSYGAGTGNLLKEPHWKFLADAIHRYCEDSQDYVEEQS